MKMLPVAFVVMTALVCPDKLSACNECHSKKPAMRKMHEALQYRDCFKCHGLGRLKKGEQQKLRMASDPLCTGCHNDR